MIIKYWQITAFQEKGPTQLKNYKGTNDYSMLDSTSIELIADSEEEALKKAKKLVERKYYRLTKMWEISPPEHGQALSQEMQMVSLKMQKQLLDTLQGLKE